MFSLNHPHFIIRDMDIYFTKDVIIQHIRKHKLGEIFDISILPGTTKFTNNVIVYMKKWKYSDYATNFKTDLINGKSVKIYYAKKDFWNATLYDPTKNVIYKISLNISKANIIHLIENHDISVSIHTSTTENQYNIIDSTGSLSYKYPLPPRRRRVLIKK